MKLKKSTVQKFLVEMNKAFIKIKNDEYSTEQLDRILLSILDYLSRLEDVDLEILSDIRENLQTIVNQTSKNKDIKVEVENILSSSKIKKLEDSYVDKRLNKHFETIVSYSTEATKDKHKDISLEVKTKNRARGVKIYFEQAKVLLTMVTSNIAIQEEITRIKEFIEDNFTFTSSIKKVIKDKDKLSRIKSLCKLQNDRFDYAEETRKRLY